MKNMAGDLDYVFVLKSLRDIPFGVGKKLLINYMQGDSTHKSIKKNNLNKLESFGCLAYEDDEIETIINNLILNNMIKQVSIKGNRFWKVMELTDEGRKEIDNPQFYKKKISLKNKTTEITEQDKKLFIAFSGFLKDYNDEQKKAIICNKSHILCIAGAGSGKTTVLTKKIEFIIKFQSVDPRKILAITFTRKAKQEMQRRLGESNVRVETFNSFCEKILKKYNDMVYDRQVHMINYRDKIIMTRKALNAMGTSMSMATSQYFTIGQKRGKTKEQLANIFMNDCFFVRDYLKSKNKKASDFDMSSRAAKLVFGVGNYIDAYMKKHGQRDFTDQIIDTINLFENHSEIIPQYEHILIDEYQDINSSQIKLIDLLNPKKIFCVGDPRQSIFGWRGSDIKYIVEFDKKYPDAETISLTKNYRSNKHIVDLINKSISYMGLADLEPTIDNKKDIHLLKFNSENLELNFVTNAIINSEVPREEIFVLARTNRQLKELSNRLKKKRIKHVVKSDEINRSVIAKTNEVTLATIHAIKGLEAELVFVIGCKSLYFPSKGSEHPVIDMIKVDEYDKEDEEKRLFYVAMSRAKNKLYLTHTGKHTYFISKEMLELFDGKKVSPISKAKPVVISGDLDAKLRDWRKQKSYELSIPSYMIMHDKTIIDILQKKPTTESELNKVYGMGSIKILKYGQELLDLITS